MPASSLLCLNDDCFYEMYKYLPITDWCSLRETCTRLRTISDDCFKRQMNSFKLSGYYMFKSRFESLSGNTLRPIFRNFGKFLTKICAHGNEFASYDDMKILLLLLNRYCTELKDLKLVKIEYDVHIFAECQRLFSNLERLVIDKCNDDNATFSTCLDHCNSLKELELVRLFNIDGRSLACHRSKLESFSIKSCDNMNYLYIEACLRLNPQLKTLKFVGCNFITDEVFEHVSNYLPNLEALSLRLFSVGRLANENLMQLLRLTKLKKFEINCGLIAINPFLNGLVNNKEIESLHLSTVDITDELIQSLCNLKTLKTLKLSSSANLEANACKKLALELPVLTEIHIIECTDTTFKKIKEFAEHSTTLKKLVFVRYSDSTQSLTKATFLSLVDARLRNSNKETLKVYLDSDDHRDAMDQFMWNQDLKLFRDYNHIIKLLPLEEEDDKLPIYEYGFGSQKPFKGLIGDIVFGAHIYDWYDEDDYSDEDVYPLDDDFDVEDWDDGHGDY